MNELMASKSILFIVPYPVGVAPSQRFRFEQYFGILKEKGYRYKVASFWSKKAWDSLYLNTHVITKSLAIFRGFVKRFFLVFFCSGYQFIFLHREALPLGPPVLEFIISRILRKKIIYDFDDAIWLPNTSEQNRIVSKLKYHQKVKQICSWSWKVSCGNDFLAEYARQFNDRVTVNPTTIDLNYHIPKLKKRADHPLTIGWTGTHSTTKYLSTLAPVLNEFRKNYPIRIMVIADQKPKWEILDYEFLKWEKEHEIDQLNEIDIGIMPLSDTVWEQGKCGFKALQYMALEIPAVVSSVGVNKKIIDHGVDGYLCATPAEWTTHLTELIDSEAKRSIVGQKGRMKVKSQYSVQSNTSLFLALFE